MGLNISLAPETLFHIGTLPISNSFFWLIILSILILIAIFFFYRSLKLRPGGFQSFMELLIEGAYNFVEDTVGDRKKAKRVFPLVFTMFFVVLLANLATFIPGQSAITINTADGVVPLFRAIIADYSFVFVITMISVLVTQIVSIAVVGPWGYITKFINFSNPLKFFLGVMDLVGELAKIMSLSFRLFGNIFAGEVLTAVILFLAPFFMPLPFAFLGILTAIVQPFVFSVLTLVFISMASQIEESENTN